MMGQGLHLLIEGLASEPLEEAAVKNFLDAAPEAIGMTPILGPATYRSSGGWSGIVVIAESHISVHSAGLAVHADIFSCKPFDVEKATGFTRTMLGLTEVQPTTINRGWAK